MKPSLHLIPQAAACAVFTSDASRVFRDDCDVAPRKIDDHRSYIPWGATNRMPYDILGLIEADETVSTCNIFNAEICYGAGLVYNTDRLRSTLKGNLKETIEDFTDCNSISEMYMGQCFDIKTFGFSVSVIILNERGTEIVSVARREALYCRFAPFENGRIPAVHYANWRKSAIPPDIETIPLLDVRDPYHDLCDRIAGTRDRKFAILARLPSVDSTYYPIPYYASLFKGSWYRIKRDIGIAKLSKLHNSAPIRYHIEIADKYWEHLFETENITDPEKMQDRMMQAKEEIIDFLSGVENSGKAWFSQFYVSPDGKEQHDVKITKIDSSKEGGDWESDIQEAVNMICFVMRIHSNLVGSVPGKSQTNNSGSDKRELYTISQASQKMYRDAIFRPHKLIIRFNGWKGCVPECPFIQLTTLDEHKDAKKVSIS